MKIFQDKGKTILPRVDSILLLSRFLVILGVISAAIFQDLGSREKLILISLSGVFGVFLAIFGYFLRNGKYNLKKSYLVVIIFELILIPALISLTGYYESNFYIFYYLTVSFAAYILAFPVSLVILGIISISYILLGVNDLFSYSAANIVLRIGFMWFLSLTISFASDYIRRSEKRLLKLFDTLNKRTSELEKSQSHLEMTYENTRVLAGILDIEGVIKEIIKILGQVMGFPASGLLLVGPAGNLIYRGRNIAGQSNFNLKAADPESNELIYRVYNQNEAVSIDDISGRQDYRSLRIVTRSVLMVPMESHGKVIGILVAESSQVGAFGEKDQNMLQVVARGAGMALENAMLHKKMEELTITDELTGIYNYRYFTQKLREEQKRAARYDLPLSLIMVDIDWFKKFNDTYGHEVGNIVLRGITSVIKRCIRDVDIFCRYGGEEFIVILPQTPQIEVSRIGERIRNQIEETTFGGGGGIPKLKVTVSVGVTSYPENGKTEDEILSVADNALYRAKGSGKNVVCVI
jgi:diguanylate cyclase (GGDEF)-like protein